MSDALYAGDKLLDAWLALTSTLWNTRLVTSMTYNEAHVMGILLRHSTPDAPMTATDLVRRTRLLKSQMNKLLSTLESKGFIVRRRAQSDRRMAYILLTPAGKTAYREEHVGVERILAELIYRLGADRALRVADDIGSIIAILDDILPGD